MWNVPLVDTLVKQWRSYKYRFVPWIAYNLKNRSVRCIKLDDIVGKDSNEVAKVLQFLLNAFEKNNMRSDQRSVGRTNEEIHARNSDVLYRELGFCIKRAKSSLKGDVGLGVRVSRGRVESGSIVALYPGTLYRPLEPIFFQSIANPFILKCYDGIYVDGNDRNISKSIYKSCVNRDRIGPYSIADLSWLTPHPLNPLTIGQYVNNQTKEHSCNVVYQEYDIPESFPLHLRSCLPNVYFKRRDSDGIGESSLRIVALIATRDINEGEELFSSYFTLIE